MHRPVASLLITGVVFLRFWTFFQGLKIGVPSGCLGETSIFLKLNDWWRYFVVTARINFISLTDDIQDVSARTVGGEVTFERRRGRATGLSHTSSAPPGLLLVVPHVTAQPSTATNFILFDMATALNVISLYTILHLSTAAGWVPIVTEWQQNLTMGAV